MMPDPEGAGSSHRREFNMADYAMCKFRYNGLFGFEALRGFMSTVTTTTQLSRVARFYDSTIGKKAVMEVTDLVLFGFLIAHMLGNLQIFLGRAVTNHYAE